MGQRIEYKKGELVGPAGLIFMGDAPNGTHGRMGCFVCPLCENTFISGVSNVKSGNAKSCGCMRYINAASSRRSHGMSRHWLYSVWGNLVARCYDPNNPSYCNYGDRGIKMCDEWRNNFKAFYDYVSQLPYYREDGYTIDRIDNDGGYEPENIRWTTKHIQNTNQSIRRDNQTGIRGVQKEGGDVYVATLSYMGLKFNIHRNSCLYESVWARNRFIIDNELWEYPIQYVDNVNNTTI